YIPRFIDAWQGGAKVVVGVRVKNSREGLVKKTGSKLFYASFNNAAHQKLVPGSTDYRLIDAAVQRQFLRLSETNRLTRGLIDWLGFERTYIPFVAKARTSGTASYKPKQLFNLA